jgi:hypothetical protein
MMEWIAIREGYNDCHPDTRGSIVIARRESGEQIIVYYHQDKMFPLARYWKDHKLSHWQRFDNGKWLYDVTHWRPLNKEDKDKLCGFRKEEIAFPTQREGL